MPKLSKTIARIRRQLRMAADAITRADDGCASDEGAEYSALRYVHTQLAHARNACQVGIDLVKDFQREVPESVIDNAPWGC